MSDHAANVRRQLGELADLSSKTDAAERRILESAERQLEAMAEKIKEVRKTAMIDKGKGSEYLDLVENRKRLEVVIAQARRNLDGK